MAVGAVGSGGVIGDHMDDPQMQSALNRMMTNSKPAVVNLEKLAAQTG